MSAPGPARKSKGNDNFETPWAVFEALNAEFRFTLDPCASENNRKCERWLEGPCDGTENCGCGLCADWLEHAVFVNPPYSQIRLWLEKGIDAAERGATVVTLIGASTSPAWFREKVFRRAVDVFFVYPRIQFIHPPACACKACAEGRKGSNGSDSLVVVYRPGRSEGGPRFSLWTWA